MSIYTTKNTIKNISKITVIFLAVVFLFCGFSKSANAACTWNGNSGTAASTSQSDVAACVTDAQSKSGDVTIQIPAGSSANWTSAISVNIGNGGKLSILGSGTNNTSVAVGADGTPTNPGAGASQTTINHTGATVFSVTINGGAQFFELGNIKTVSTSTAASDGAVVSIIGTAEARPKFRIHDCIFTHAPYRVLSAVKIYGVYDHNTDIYTQNQVIIIQGGKSTADQNAAFSSALGIPGDGTLNAVFIENNLSTYPNKPEPKLAFVENEFGGRAVVRYNKIFERGLNTHGYHDVDSTSRGPVFTDLYNNYFDCTVMTCSHGWFGFRSGSGHIYNNNVVETNMWGWKPGRGVEFHYYGLCRDECGANGGNGYDGSGECISYPCPDQPGFYGTTAAPVYIWNNTFPNVPGEPFLNIVTGPCKDGQNCDTSPTAPSPGTCSGGTDRQTCFVKAERDYHYHTNNTPPPSNLYTAAAYPHPLTLTGQLTCTPGDANSDGNINISDVQTCINVILGTDTTHQACSDMNTSGTVDITDCQAVINKILNP